MSTNYEVIKCPICGDSRYKELESGYKCKTCDNVFFKVSEEETYKLHEAKSALEIYNFTKADQIYHNILNETTNEKTKVMCYFGRLLAYFGVVYVKDFNGNLVITISNYDPEFSSIKESTYYKQIEESSYKNLYTEQLEKLDKEYQRIKTELNKGNKYDVFICTKISLKTKDNPDLEGRTNDSFTALQIYDELTKKGLNVFYSDKVLSGIDYDAQIFSALIRSKNIIVITSKKEYLESAWVESEWQRWINFIKKDVKENNSLYLYIPNGTHFELPSLLQKTQKFSDTLGLVNRIDEIYHPVKQEVKKIDIEEELVTAENDLLFGELETAEKTYKQLIKDYPKDYRPWLGLVKVLEEEGVSSEDRRYKNFINKVISLCKDEQEKSNILSKYSKYLEESKQEIVEEKKENVQQVVNSTIKKVVEQSAEKQEEPKNLAYKLNNYTKSYTVIGNLVQGVEEVKIPPLHNGLPVTEIGNTAFYSCKKLKNIEIPHTIKSIDKTAFQYCDNLTNIYYNGTIEDWCRIKFEYGESNPMGKNKHFYALDENKKYQELTEIIIPNTVTSIGDYQFCGFDTITKITIPNSVKKVGEYAFSGCHNLKIYCEAPSKPDEWYKNWNPSNLPVEWDYINKQKYNMLEFKLNQDKKSYNVAANKLTNNFTEIKIPSFYNGLPVSVIKESAFKSCFKVKSIYIPDSITSIGFIAFRGCASLEKIEVDKNNRFYKTIAGNLYTKDEKKMIQYANGKQDIHFAVPNTVTRIETYAFEGCKKLTSIEIPTSVITIGGEALSCPNLSKLYYKGTIEDWCRITFNDYDFTPVPKVDNIYMLDKNNEYYEVTEIEIPDTITSIGKYQFYGFDNVTKIILPKNIENIGEDALSCDKLSGIYYKGTIEDWCHIIFKNYDSNPGNYVDHIYMLDNNNKYYEAREIIVPSTITSIGKYQFFGFVNLEKITISSEVTRIGERAFCSCQMLKNIYIPKTVTEVGVCSFGDCLNLTNVYFNGDIEDWWKIKFNGKESNPMECAENLYLSKNGKDYYNSTILEIPSTIKVLKKEYFEHMKNIEVVYIPKSVVRIESNVFENYTNLTIYCETKKPLFKKQPDGWAENWNSGNLEVVWGKKYDGEIVSNLSKISHSQNKKVNTSCCSNCGARLRPGARFCSFCGNIVRTNNQIE